MTSEERDLITRFIERAAGAGQGAGQPLPPLDPEADRLIADLFARYPEARYRITQMAMVEEHALVEAQNRIARLQWELQQMRQAQAGVGPAQGGSPWGAGAAPQQSRGFLSGLFGGGGTARPTAPPPPPPQYAPPPPQYPQGYNPGMFQSQGSGFLGSALRTAAGVAGGVLAADALTSLFSGRHEGMGGFGGGWGGGPEQVVEVVPGGNANPWGAPGGDAGDYGGAAKEPMDDDKFAGPAQIDQADWTPAPDQGGGWQDAAVDPAADQGGGWDQASDDTGGWSDDIQDT
jgi:hypothetical protein